MTIRLIILFGLVAGLITSRLRDRARRRREETERQPNEERLQSAARDLDGKVIHSQDGGAQYGDAV